MNEAPDLELTLLALEGRPRGYDSPPELAYLQGYWRRVRLGQDGERQLAFWRGPGDGGMVVLTEGRPPERLLAAADHGSDDRRYRPDSEPSSFLYPGHSRWRRPALADFDIFVGWWPAEPETRGLRLVRRERAVELVPSPEGFVLVDWSSAAPVERFETVEIEGQGWVPTVLPGLPYTVTQLWRVYQDYKSARADSSGSRDATCWAYEVFDVGGEPFLDAVVAILAHADSGRDFDALCGFGAHIYANGNDYYDRMERELARGGVKRENLGIVLSMEKPEFMDDALRIRHQRLVARCG